MLETTIMLQVTFIALQANQFELLEFLKLERQW